MQKIEIENISSDEFVDTLTKKIMCEFKKLLPKDSINEKKEIYATRKETAKALHISLPTLNEHTKNGIIKGYRISKRVLYKWEDINESLDLIQSLKYKREI